MPGKAHWGPAEMVSVLITPISHIRMLPVMPIVILLAFMARATCIEPLGSSAVPRSNGAKLG